MPEKSEITRRIDCIEAAVYKQLKPFGFSRHGRTLHRFVDGDISQVINFQCGQSYLEMTHLMWVNLGIRVPESFDREFFPSAPMKKFYHEYHCNIRSRIGQLDGGDERTFDLLCEDVEAMAAEIAEELFDRVLPVYDILSSRDAILARRRDYPHFDQLNRHLILLEEAMIHGRRGDMERACAMFGEYYRACEVQAADPRNRHIRGHIEYLDELAARLGLSPIIPSP